MKDERRILISLIDANYDSIFPSRYFVVAFDALPSAIKLSLKKVRKWNPVEIAELIRGYLPADMAPSLGFISTQKLVNYNEGSESSTQVLECVPGRFVVSIVEGYNLQNEVIFFFEESNSKTKSLVEEMVDKLHSHFKLPDAPKFSVLVHKENKFDTTKVDIKNFKEVSIDDMYNDDFASVHTTIVNSMTEARSGIILLHGEPGTGKTSYIKHLISMYPDKNFIFVQNDFVGALLKPEFISFLLERKDTVLVIEDAERVVVSREESNESGSVVSTILQLTDGLFSDYLNMKIICTFNTTIDKVDKALQRKGRMIAKYHFKALSVRKTSVLLRKLNDGRDPRRGGVSLSYVDQREETLGDIFRYSERSFKDADKRPMGF